MFAALDERRRRASRVSSAAPCRSGRGHRAQGERGDAMYFISSGAVEVRIVPNPVHLGTGDFFGEIALLLAGRRNADVVSLGYCQILSFSSRDLHRLFGAEPSLRDPIIPLRRRAPQQRKRNEPQTAASRHHGRASARLDRR